MLFRCLKAQVDVFKVLSLVEVFNFTVQRTK